MPKLLIVDGCNLLFQMFFGMPSRIIGRGGRAVQGVVGFTGALLKIIRLAAPSHAIVVFDGETSNPRCTLDPEYKANRPDFSEAPDEENPFTQLPDIFRVLDRMGISYFETEDVEADDVIASYAKSFAGEVVISSFDSDFFQLISDSCSVLRYRGENSVLCTPEYVKAKCGVYPEKYAEHKSLVGDASDNIVGIKGIGPKTAAELLLRFGSLDALTEHPELIERERVRSAVRESVERLKLNYSLIKLSGDAALPIQPDSAPLPDLSGCHTIPLLRELGIM